MKTELIATLGTVAGVGGIALGVLFFLFREVIRKRIFPTLTKEQAYKTINRLISLTALVAIVGLVVWAATELVPAGDAPEVKSGSLEVVDVQFQEKVEGFPVLDIKLRNTGEVSFLKSAIFKVEKAWTFESYYCPNAEPASWNYDVLLPIAGTPYERSVPISQSVKPQDVDRFTFTLGNDAPPILGMTKYVFLLVVEFVYDEDDKRLTTPPISFISGPAASILAFTTCRDTRPVYVQNKSVVDALVTFSGVTNTGLENIREYLSKSIVPELLKNLEEADTDEEAQKWVVEFLALIKEIDPTAAAALRDLANNSESEFVKKLAEQLKDGKFSL